MKNTSRQGNLVSGPANKLLQALLMVVACATWCTACSPAKQTTTGSGATSAMPNWSGGVWRRVAAPEAADVGSIRGDALPLTPEWRIKSNALNTIREQGGVLPANDSQCIPSGMPFMMVANGLEFVYSPGRIGIVAGGRGFQIRNIWVDGRMHTADELLFDSFSGESIGHWEGDTLVVDTIALRNSNEMVYALKGTKLHVAERFHQLAPGELEIQTTVTDPQALASPWVYTTTYKQNPQQFLNESYCVAAFDRSVDARTGEQGFDLTPPPEEGIGVSQSIAVH